ncbi:MAG: hypothetical protein KDK35_21205 [Leptospiraceae bacterium]|nr:hypothetical protein [Leptospiraceae bacterium]
MTPAHRPDSIGSSKEVFASWWTEAGRKVRHPFLRWFAPLRLRHMASSVLRQKGARTFKDPGDIGAELQRMFPDRGMYRIEELRDDGIVMDIHIDCPLRGSGDRAACQRLMTYDRTLASGIGGRLEVLESQAENGGHTCRVYIKPKN